MTTPHGELIHSFSTTVRDERGGSWRAEAFGRPAGNVWLGWIAFTDDTGAVVRTDVETSQPDRKALSYWTSGIEPIYLEGALARARGVPI